MFCDVKWFYSTCQSSGKEHRQLVWRRPYTIENHERFLVYLAAGL